ncbi:MAG: copper chaperone PCu(A)C [Gallionella sp.]
MNKLIKLGALLCAAMLSTSVYAGNIQVESAWSRATAPGQDTAMVDLVISSVQQAKLIGFSSPNCKKAQIHRMTQEDGMMKMREVQAIDLPAGKRVSLSAQGYHLMLIGIKSPLKAGDQLPLTLHIKISGKNVIDVQTHAVVRSLNSMTPMPGMPHR